jgi:hypothetical protein
MEVWREPLTAPVKLPTKRRMGRKKEFAESLRVPLAAGTTARMDAVLEPDEPRLSLIREAIDREILRRATAKARQRQAEARLKS